LGLRQKALGLDVLPLANGGRAVQTFRTGVSHTTGRADLDDEELPGIVRDLGVRSQINVVLEIEGERRGVLSVVSPQPERFDPNDVNVLELVGKWVSALVQRANLVAKLRADEAATARQATAERIVTVVSHDIRNHLQPLAGRLYALKLRVEQGQPIEPRAVDTMLDAARRLSRLTNTWLDMSRLDQDLFELRFGPVRLNGLMQEIANTLSTPRVQIRVAAPSDVTLVGDAERLQQAFENVLANAVRHSPEDGVVDFLLEPPDSSNRIRIVIRDQGPGIPPELRPHLFERFVTSGASGGIGLGLYLAERIAVAHGGSLEVESPASAGAQFAFVLPLDANRTWEA
jgi:signal transduction histidine kinase